MEASLDIPTSIDHNKQLLEHRRLLDDVPRTTTQRHAFKQKLEIEYAFRKSIYRGKIHLKLTRPLTKDSESMLLKLGWHPVQITECKHDKWCYHVSGSSNNVK